MRLEMKYHVTLWEQLPHSESAPYKVLGAMDLVMWRNNVFDLPRDHDIKLSRDFVDGVPSS